MTAVSFSVKCGSFDSLNVFRRCGLRPCASQIRCTVAALTPCALAIERQLQCVCPGGFVCVVACTICLIFAAEIAGLRPRPGFVSVNAAVPPSSNRRRHRITVGRLTPSLRAISLFDSPAAAASTIRARKATLCGLFCAATQRPSSARCSTERAVAAIAAATRSTLLHHYPYVKLFQRQCHWAVDLSHGREYRKRRFSAAMYVRGARCAAARERSRFVSMNSLTAKIRSRFKFDKK